jgi:hypothetical protein
MSFVIRGLNLEAQQGLIEKYFVGRPVSAAA